MTEVRLERGGLMILYGGGGGGGDKGGGGGGGTAAAAAAADAARPRDVPGSLDYRVTWYRSGTRADPCRCGRSGRPRRPSPRPRTGRRAGPWPPAGIAKPDEGGSGTGYSRLSTRKIARSSGPGEPGTAVTSICRQWYPRSGRGHCGPGSGGRWRSIGGEWGEE